MIRHQELLKEFGNIDIYLFDQLLKGRFDRCTRVLDAGCGRGRNLVYLMRNRLDVHGIDRDRKAVEDTRKRAARIVPGLPESNFRVAELDTLPFENHYFDAVICNAVLHFSENEAHFHRIVNELWRVLKPGGLFLARLSTTIGMDGRLTPLRGGRFQLPDGKKWFLADESLILETGKRLGGKLLDPVKTTIVQNVRSMTTWCLEKPKPEAE